MNNKGQFSIIAALLVAVVLIASVVTTYSAIRYNPVQDQPQILSTIDETNLALKQILGFTVGYYGSVLKVTGNVSYARQLATNYLKSGLNNVGEIRPERGASFNVTSLELNANWFTANSYSQGTITVNYDLNGLGISGISYSTSTRLDVQISSANSTNQAQLRILKDDGEPLINLGKSNLKFYRFLYGNLSWELIEPTSIISYADGTYLIDVPPGVPGSSFGIQVEDTRGIIVVASSFSHFTSTLTWNSTSVQQGFYYVDNANLNVTGTHSNFNAQQAGPDGIYDTLTEQASGIGAINYYPLNCNLLGSTTIAQSSGNITADTDSNDGNYLQFHSYPSAFSGTANVGYTTPETATQDLNNHIRGSVFTVGNGGQAQSISAYLSVGYRNATVKAAIYSTNFTLIGSTPEQSVSVTSGAWVTFNFVIKPMLNANTNYIFVVWGKAGNGGQVNICEVNAANQGYYDSQTYNNNWPDNLHNEGYKYSIYCNYTLATQYTVQAELVGTVDAINWQQLIWAVDTAVTAGTANCTLQLYNFTSSQYPTSDYGYINVPALSTSDSLQTQTIDNNPTNFRNSTNGWKLMLTAVNMSAAQFDLKIDLTQLTSQFTNYAVNLQEQWLNVNATNLRQDLCIKTGTGGAEPVMVQVLHDGSWQNLMTLVPNYFNNVSLAPYIDSSNLTIRFVGSNDITDPSPDSWDIDAVYIKPERDISFLVNLQDSTFTLEVLQNGTMRWLGQNLQLTTETLPIPPIPVKAIHVNQTINGVNQEVPFQIEDWASDYQIPLGLTNNATVFSNRQMIVFLLNSKVTDFTIWWDGSDTAVQTPLAYTNTYFHDSTASLNNGKITLSISTDSAFTVTSQVIGKSTSSATNFMRINNEASTYGAGSAYVISNGTVRDIIQQEAEWGSGISETLYVDSFDNTNTQWTATGSSPYLNNNDGNYISINKNNYVEGWFGFQNLSINTFAGLKIEFECRSSGDDYIQFQVTDGVTTSNWYDIKNLPSSYGWVSYDLSSVVTSVTQLNNLKVSIRYVQVGSSASTINIRRCDLDVVTVPNVYASIVLTLPAAVTYYTYQLRLMFINSTQPRTITDLSPIQLTTSLSSVQTQTENSTIAGFPIVQNGTGTFFNYTSGGWTAHHWSQFISDTGKGAGIMFTDKGNQKLYTFDSIPGSSTGALNVNSASRLIELMPVNITQVRFTYAYDITWQGAVATFDNTTPVCSLYDGTTPMGLWILAEYPPTLTVTAKS